MTKNEDEFQKSDQVNFRYCPLIEESVVICQPPIINGGGDRFWKWSKMVEFPTFMASWPWPWIQAWSLVFSSLIEYYLYTKFHRNRRNFLWTYGSTDERTDGKLLPIVLGRLPKFGSWPKNVCLNGLQWKNKFDLIWSSITLSNCSDNVKTKNYDKETNWDSCPIQAEFMSMKQTLRNSQYSIEGHRIFPPP